MSVTFGSDCPWCMHKSVGFMVTGHHLRDTGRSALLGVCTACGEASVHYFFFQTHLTNVHEWLSGKRSDGFYRVCNPQLSEIAPTMPHLDIPEALPIAIEEEFSEAEECYLNGKTIKSAARAYRSTIEAALDDNEAAGKNIYDKIEFLYKSGLLTVTLKDFAHTIRIIGNDAAHGNKVTKNEVADIRAFTKQLMLYLGAVARIVRDYR